MLMGVLLFVACEKEDEPTPEEKQIDKIIDETPVDPYTVAMKLIEQAGWPLEEELDFEVGSVQLMNYSRTVVAGDIVHYRFEVQVGSDPNDKIGIHRVVKETSGKPLLTGHALFFQHGDAKDFTGMVLPATYSPSTPSDYGFGIYMAENGVDVWGIDQSWCFVDETVTDFTFMKDWGLEKVFTDIRTAMAVARIARYLTGNDLDKMNLLGYSSGVGMGFAALDKETQLDPDVRHIKGFIPVDLAVKMDVQALQDAIEAQRATYAGQWDAGTYQSLIPFQPIGFLGRTNPDGDSPIVPGFTNYQVAMFYGGGATFPGVTFHYFAADYVDNFPATFKYITLDQYWEFMESAIYCQPMKFFIDNYTVWANNLDSPYDDHYSEIKVPILNASPAGGFGEQTLYGIGLMGSTDVQHLIPALETPENVLSDFAHIDVFLGYNAESVMWAPMLSWLKAH